MTITQLEYFKVLAENEHLLTSAKILHISGSALSSSLKSLEDELGAPLFDRVGRNIRLNSNGEIFLKYASDCLRSLEEGRKAVSDAVKTRNKTVRFAATNLAFYTVQRQEFAQLYAEIDIDQFEIRPSEALDFLMFKDMDFIVTGNDLTSNSNLMCREINYRPDKVVLVVSPENPLSKQTHCTLSDLSRETLLTRDKDSELQSMINQVLNKHNAQFYKKRILDEITIAHMVWENKGVTFATQLTAFYVNFYMGLPTLTVAEFESLTYRNRIYWRKDRTLSPSAVRVIDTMCHTSENVSAEMIDQKRKEDQSK